MLFQPDKHVTASVEKFNASPEIFEHIPFPVINNNEDFMREFYKHIVDTPEECLYAIFDKLVGTNDRNRYNNYAGIICLSHTNPTNAFTEIGVIIFPKFQRTHVTTNAIGLVLLWTLDPPSSGGLGLRRVEWRTNAKNSASRRTALRMGFEFEGIARWDCVFPGGKSALPVDELQKRNGTNGELPGRHTAIYSIVWDEWDKKRSILTANMDRRG
jgi:RimJ/RimL family protein N-acetyltransferase